MSEPFNVSLENVHSYYHQRHLETPANHFWELFDSLDMEEASLQLALGIADRSLNSQLARRAGKLGIEQRKQLQFHGLLKDTGFETLSGLVVPFYNDNAEVSNLYSYMLGTRNSGELHWLNNSGFLKLGTGSKAIYSSSPLDIITLTGCGLHEQYTLICSPSYETVEPVLAGFEVVYSLDVFIPASAECRFIIQAHKTLFDCFKKEGKEAILYYIMQAPLAEKLLTF